MKLVYCSLLLDIMKDFSKLKEKLGLEFKNQDLLIQAFIHRSYLNENPDSKLNHNERLEFLGDAVLELIVTDNLFKNYPNEEEGNLTSWRAALVNADQLSDLARELNFNEFLLLSKGEKKEKGKARKYILADTFEAFIGALYLDSGYEECRKFIEKYLMKKLPHIIEAELFKDPKSTFQEEAQERISVTPVYEVLKEWGPDHDKHFEMGVFLKDKLVAKGEGSSKFEAEQEAAKKALKKKNW